MSVSEQKTLRQKFKDKEHYHVPMGITTEEVLDLFKEWLQQKQPPNSEIQPELWLAGYLFAKNQFLADLEK